MNIVDFDIVVKNTLILFDLAKANKTKSFIRTLNDFAVDHVNINFANDSGEYLIFIAIHFNNIKIIQALIDHEVRLDVRSKQSKSVLHAPIKYAYYDILQLLLNYNRRTLGFDIINASERTSPPLFYAIRRGDIFIVKLLIEHGADVNYHDLTYDTTPLMEAIIHHRIDIVEYLIPLCRKTINLLQHHRTQTPLIAACRTFDMHIIKHMLNHGALINSPTYDINGVSDYPIHVCAQMGRLNIFILLAEQAEFDINIQTFMGDTALLRAFEYHKTNMISYILSHFPLASHSKNARTIDVNIANVQGMTIGFHILLKPEYYEYGALILPYANLNIRIVEGDTILTYLAQQGLWPIFKDYLNLQGVNLFYQNAAGKTALNYLSESEAQTLIDMTTEAYYAYLMKHARSWIETWENECSEGQAHQKEYCLRKIRDQIEQQHISFPIKSATPKIMFVEGELVLFSSFVGSVYDNLAGLNYLQNKYDHVHVYGHNMSKINIEKDFYRINFTQGKLQILPDFERSMMNLMNDERIVICSIYIMNKQYNHINILLFNTATLELELFNPSGPMDDISAIIQRLFRRIVFKKYNTQRSLIMHDMHKLTRWGHLQNFENLMANKSFHGDINGWCLAWCIWYADHRLSHAHIPFYTFYKHLYRQTLAQFSDLKAMIRNYASIITRIRDRVLQKYDLNFNQLENTMRSYVPNHPIAAKLVQVKIDLLHNTI